jgi:hypothetical protein
MTIKIGSLPVFEWACDALSTKAIDPGARASHSDFLSNRF